jgi:hypothetical protein
MERGPFANTFVCDTSGISCESNFIKSYDAIECVPDDQAIREFARLYFQNGISNWEQPDLSAEKREFYKKYNIPEDKLLIFFPLQLDNDTNSKLFSPYYSSVLEAYIDIVNAVNGLVDNVYLLVKRHPRQKNINSFESVTILSGVLVDDAHIFDCIRYSDVIISINSSSAVEAALIGKPVLLLGESILTTNNKVLKIENKDNLQCKLKKLITMVEYANDSIDTVFFSKLLFHYLYTPKAVYQDIGISSVEKIPTPEPRHLNDKTSFTQNEAILTAQVLALFHRCLGQDLNIDGTLQHLDEIEVRLADKERLQAENIKLLQQKDRQIDAIYNSFSWRVTKLLRAVCDLFYAWRKNRGGNS